MSRKAIIVSLLVIIGMVIVIGYLGVTHERLRACESELLEQIHRRAARNQDRTSPGVPPARVEAILAKTGLEDRLSHMSNISDGILILELRSVEPEAVLRFLHTLTQEAGTDPVLETELVSSENGELDAAIKVRVPGF